MAYQGPWSDTYIETQYLKWKDNPEQVDKDWQFFFQGFELGFSGTGIASAPDISKMAVKQSRVEALIYRYRDLGHLLACLDPLEACPTDHPLLNIKAFDLTHDDLDKEFFAPGLAFDRKMKLKDILTHLKETYCHSVGVEYMHLQDPDEREWLQNRLESQKTRSGIPVEEKLRILNKLCQAKRFESYVNKKYLGQKRFSVEGSEVIIPLIDRLFNHAVDKGCQEIVLGMSHRGRLNVQVNNLNKSYEDIFREFEGQYNPEGEFGTGDVKYHKGFQGTFTARNGKQIQAIMANNPSHLESVNPVVEGMARARQDIKQLDNPFLILPVLLHGDAAFAGQGIVTETMNMSQLDGYKTGGTIHIIVNNQIGYTTLPQDARSTRYSTDNAKSQMVPIFHVHGEDPEAVMQTIDLAVDYRMKFAKDVVIDVVCYRLYGHNEGDEPYFTQPAMYERIRSRVSIDQIYGNKLVDENILKPEDIDKINSDIDECLDMAFTNTKTEKPAPSPRPASKNLTDIPDVHTAVDKAFLISLARKINHIPEGFRINAKLEKLLDKRLEAFETGTGIDWGNGEALAFATILAQGVSVRLSGEDSQRGTFSHRHSVLFDTETDDTLIPLANIGNKQGIFYSINSPLSEAGVLGFEYGYSITRPDCLTLWEAQFGDFVNNAQVVLDQYVVSGETKWQSKSGLVLLLPHGYEGMGPEHSSARLERFLQLCADNNIQVSNPTTPAQIFHLLRRQTVGKILKPLIILTPKSLLRHPMAVSELTDFTESDFLPVIDDLNSGKNTKKVVFVSGKLYYELLNEKDTKKADHIQLVRIEQLYPFPLKQIEEIVQKYKRCKTWIWAQEEPENQGGWHFIALNFKKYLSMDLEYIGRKASPSPSTGYLAEFKKEQEKIIKDAISGS
ncbi:MAG: 2-oxoglutarate dehydrogenase E1 component [Proteobacteria bacterium]|nr:2-oxoglutarate dehydrogenase E1 component [Pseudomonadota bacterium]